MVAAGLAREVVDKLYRDTGKRVLVAGAVGPMNRTLSLSPKVEDPAYRNVSKSYILLL